MIAAFDLATETGGCDGLPSEVPRLWTWHLRDAGDSRPARLLMLHNFVRSYFEDVRGRLDLVVYEAPIPIAAMMKIGANDATITFLRAAIGVLELNCARVGVEVMAISVQDARESVLGWRTSRSNTKRRVLTEVDRIYDVQPDNDNEADAFVIWRCMCNRINPRLALTGVPLFTKLPT